MIVSLASGARPCQTVTSSCSAASVPTLCNHWHPCSTAPRAIRSPPFARSDREARRAIIESLAGTRDRTNVYVNVWRRLGVLIGDGRFAFILYECLCSIVSINTVR
jgi:hypothetical protein